jgi:hypothetical protein
MEDSVTARAQADQALEQAAQALKRHQGADRKVLQAIRQAQAVLKGVLVEITESEGGQSHGSSEIEAEA